MGDRIDDSLHNYSRRMQYMPGDQAWFTRSYIKEELRESHPLFNYTAIHTSGMCFADTTEGCPSIDNRHGFRGIRQHITAAKPRVCRWCGEPMVLAKCGTRCKACNGPVKGGIYG